MKWREAGVGPCSVARSLAVVGDRWTLLILRDAFLGVRRFEGFQVRLGLARNVLASRLRVLVGEGVMQRRAYQSRPTRFEYRLTKKGLDLYPVVMALVRWGNDYYSQDGLPALHRHTVCGHDFDAGCYCRVCGGELAPHEVEVRAAAGFPHPLTPLSLQRALPD